MTKPAFPSKQEIESPKKGMRASLGFRVLIISVLCVILPLCAYVGILWWNLLLEDDRDLFEQISHISDVQKELADSIFAEAIVQMRGASLLASQTTDKEALRRNFQALLSGYPERMLCIATQGENDNLDIKMSSEPSFEGHFLTKKMPMELALERLFVFFCFCQPQQMAIVGSNLPSGEKLLLVFPGDSLVQISPQISDWAGIAGVELFQNNISIVKKPPTCSEAQCRIFTETDIRSIINDDVDTPHLNKTTRIAETSQLYLLPLNLQVSIPPIYYSTRFGLLLQYIGIALLVIIVFGAIAAYLLTHFMVRPYEYLAGLMHKAGQADFEARYLPQYMAFEINQLGSHFNYMMLRLKNAIEDLKKEQTAKAKMLQECETSLAIEKAILPRLHPQLPQLDISAHFVAGEDISGDFYDLFLHDSPQGKRLLIVIGDASGKGIAASMYSFLLRSILRSFVSTGESLEKVVEHANQLFCMDTETGGMFVTAWIGLLDIASNRLEFTSVGHYPAIWRKHTGDVLEIKTSGSAFGLPFTQAVSTQTIELQKKDILFLYTDGWVETKRHGIPYNRTHLIELMAQASPDLSAKDLLISLESFILEQGEWTDEDRTALLIKFL